MWWPFKKTIPEEEAEEADDSEIAEKLAQIEAEIREISLVVKRLENNRYRQARRAADNGSQDTTDPEWEWLKSLGK